MMADLDGRMPMAFQQSLFEALLKNNKMNAYWSERQKVYQELQSNLDFYVHKLKHEIYAPVGKKAFMKGTIVHTNDITVAIGCGYFLKVSSSCAKEICERRLKEIDQIILKLEQEKLFIENKINLPVQVFDSERREIIEPYDEEEEKKWREKHQNKIREHKKELAKIREQILSNKLDTQDDHMKHLDLLEMQEELEEEIDRLGGDSSESEFDEEVEEEDDLSQVEEIEKPVKIEKKVRFEEQEDDLPQVETSVKIEKKVRFEDSVKVISNDQPISDVVRETIPNQTENFKRPISKFKASRHK